MPRSTTQPSQAEDETLRILVATDNHLGVNEKDPIRGNDSFETFEEILQIAKERRADCVLLGASRCRCGLLGSQWRIWDRRHRLPRILHPLVSHTDVKCVHRRRRSVSR